MTDKVLEAIAKRHPKTAAELLAIPGIGINAVENLVEFLSAPRGGDTDIAKCSKQKKNSP